MTTAQVAGLQMISGGKMPKLNYIYIFDCVHCSNFYGEQTLTRNGDLVCPNCHAEQRIDSPYVEQVKVTYKPKAFEVEQQNVQERIAKYEFFSSEVEMLIGFIGEKLDDLNLTARRRKSLESIYYELTKEV
jgi:DNA-directed RNA polymerase subunit M/transcription elongation factor TFIIS